MMKLCNDAITVFNARLDEEKGYDVYVPTVISGVSWFCEVASSVELSGLKAADRFVIRIPEDADFGGKSYVSPVGYAAADPDAAFTLRQGDIIVKGAETGPMRPAELKERHGEMVTILGVTDNRRAPHAPHWKVVGA